MKYGPEDFFNPRKLLCTLLYKGRAMLSIFTWSLIRQALRAHSGLDTAHGKQNSSVSEWEEGRKEGKRKLKL